MLKVKESQQFRRDVKNCVKRRKNMARFEKILEILRIPEELPPQCRDHALTGDYAACRECHIEPDWLLIYRYKDGGLFLYRMGTHSDLFGHTRRK